MDILREEKEMDLELCILRIKLHKPFGKITQFSYYVDS